MVFDRRAMAQICCWVGNRRAGPAWDCAPLGAGCRISGDPEGGWVYFSFLKLVLLGLSLWGPLGFVQSCFPLPDGSTKAQSAGQPCPTSWGKTPGRGAGKGHGYL